MPRGALEMKPAVFCGKMPMPAGGHGFTPNLYLIN